MRVLMLADWCASPGGTERSLGWIRDGFRQAGDEVRLLTSSVGDADGGRADYVAFGTERALPQVALQLVNPFAVRAVRQARREFRPDVALIWMFEMHLSPAVLHALRGVPTLAVVLYPKPICPTASKMLPDGSLCTSDAGLTCWRSGCVSLPHWLRDRPRYRLIESGLRDARGVLTCSDSLTNDLRRRGVAAETIDLAVPQPGDDERREPAPDPVFAYVGRLSPEKGVDILLRAFARLRERHATARLRIVGDGASRERLERLAASLGLDRRTVTFTGRLPGGEAERTLADAWALVAPSRWAEPFGLVALEALVRGVPVVASATGGFARTVEDGVTGLLFPNGDEEALHDRLEAIATGRCFPEHTLPEAKVAEVRDRFNLARHVETVRARTLEAMAA
jgi:glycosyltransferase involved in cell wall biosynthesis